MTYQLNEKRLKKSWNPYKIAFLYILSLFLCSFLVDKLLDAYFFKLNLPIDIHTIANGLSTLISGFILYTIIKRDRKELLASQRQLQDDQKTLHTLINNVPDLVYLKDKEGHWMEANKASLCFFGIENNTMYKEKTSANIINSLKDRDNFISICSETDDEAWSSKMTVRFEQNFKKMDGTTLVYDVIKVPIFDTDGQPKVLVVTARDITERKVMESRLKESEQQYESLYNSVSSGIVLKNNKGTIIHINEEASKILEIKLEEVNGTRLETWDFVKEDGSLISVNEHPYTIALRTGKRIRNVVMGVKHFAQSSYRWILANYEPIFDAPNGPPTKVLANFLDITKLRQTQEKLQESEERYRLLIENSPDKISVVKKAMFYFINREGAAIMGAKNPEEIIGRSVFDFIEKNYRNYLRDIGNKVEREKIIIGPFEYRMVTLDNRIIDVETIFIPITYEGEPASLSVSRNITERKKMEEALRKADIISVAGNLAAGVAHEVRNPLTVIRGFIQLLKHEDKGKNPHFDIMLSEVDRIELIIREFLMLSKPQSLTFKESDIKTIIQHTVALFETQAIMKNIEIFTVYDDNLPMIECEENQLKQVFINLLKNAMEAMPEGGTIIVEGRKQDDNIILRFIDQGCGIPEEKIKKLAEPFYTTKEKGTGLGLMVSYNIIKNHGGNIHVKSKLGEGTTFEILFPLVSVLPS